MTHDTITYKIGEFDIPRIMEKIPHRAPLLLVDRVHEITPFHSIEAVKSISYNEPFFPGHFPSRPVMPGVLIIEAMAQAAGILVVESLGTEAEGKLVFFMSIDNAKFRKLVTPGDKLILKSEVIQMRKTVWKFKGEAYVDDQLCTEATYTAMLVDDEGS